MINILSKYPNREKMDELGGRYMHSYDKEERNLRKIVKIEKLKSFIRGISLL